MPHKGQLVGWVRRPPSHASYRIDTRLMFAGIAFSSAAGILFFNFISGLEKLLLRWPGARPED